MNRAVNALMLACLMTVGCESLPRLWEHPKPPQTPVAEKPAPPPLVTAEQVNDKNAHEKAQALLDEMDRDAQGQLAPVEQPAKTSAANSR